MSAMRAAWCVCAVLAAAAAWGLPGAAAYVHHRGVAFGEDATVYLFSEGAMFSTDSPPWGNGESYIDVVAEMKPAEAQEAQAAAMVNVVFFDDDNSKAVGWPVAAGGTFPQLCCGTNLIEEGDCQERGRLALRTGEVAEGVPLPTVSSHLVPGDRATTAFNDTFVVRNAGVQYAMIVVCDVRGDSQAMGLNAKLEFEFHNPYGYIPGIWFALLPFYGALALVYTVTLLVYTIIFLANRSMLLPLQYCVLGVVLMGTTESAVFFFMFLSKNSSGIAPCCPVTTDFLAAVVLRVMKSTVSRVLILAVCLGFGVVKPKLDRSTTAYLGVLAASFLLASIINDVKAASSTEVVSTGWDLIVLFLNFIFAFWIWHSLSRTKLYLKGTRQNVKLEMYNYIGTTLQVFVLVWAALSVIMIMIGMGLLPLPWRALWVPDKFWDVLYYAIMLVIAIIWAPSERAMQYSLYSQGSTGQTVDSDGEYDEEVGIELAAQIGEAERFDEGDEAGAGEVGEDAFRIAGSDDDEEEVALEDTRGAAAEAETTAASADDEEPSGDAAGSGDQSAGDDSERDEGDPPEVSTDEVKLEGKDD